MNSKVKLSSCMFQALPPFPPTPRASSPSCCPSVGVSPMFGFTFSLQRPCLSMAPFEPLTPSLDFPWFLRNSPSAVLCCHQSLNFSSPCAGDITGTPKESYQGAPPLECRWHLPLASHQHNMAKGSPVTVLVAEGDILPLVLNLLVLRQSPRLWAPR